MGRIFENANSDSISRREDMQSEGYEGREGVASVSNKRADGRK